MRKAKYRVLFTIPDAKTRYGSRSVMPDDRFTNRAEAKRFAIAEIAKWNQVVETGAFPGCGRCTQFSIDNMLSEHEYWEYVWYNKGDENQSLLTGKAPVAGWYDINK